MQIGLVGSPRDIHLRRWGQALARAGAEVWVLGLEKPPGDAIEREGMIHLRGEAPLPYVVVGKGLERPTYLDFFRWRGALGNVLRRHAVSVAHPIHLSPYGVWVYLSGFRPYVPFAMGAEIEYTVWGRAHVQRGFWTSHPILTPLRQHLLPTLLRPTLDNAALILADNYTICENIKMLSKNKKLLEIPAGVWHAREVRALSDPTQVAALYGSKTSWVLSPRGLTRFYQADYILQGFASYWEGGGHLGLILLSNLYLAEKNVLEILKNIQKKFSEKVKSISTLLGPHEMEKLWQEVVAFVSAPSYDGYSYSVAEGRLAGAIPLLSAIPGNLEIATHAYNALLVHPFTPENLANTLHTLEKNLPTLQETFAPRNQKWIQHFSDIDRHAKLFLQVLSEILPKR